MSTEWWDEGFSQQYSVIKRFCIYLTSMILFARVIIAVFISYEAAFGNSQWLIMLSAIIGLGLLSYLENSSLGIKKAYFFLLMQFFSANNRFLSIKIAANAAIPLCIHSTVLLLLFESCIFKNSISIILLMVKHIFLWVFIDFDDMSFKMDFGGKGGIVIISSLISMLLAWYFESCKQKNLIEKYESTQKWQSAHNQLLEILKAFPDGLVVFDSDFKVKFQNNSISPFFCMSTNSLGEKLFQYKVGEFQISVLELVKEFLIDSNQTNSSLGIGKIGPSQYEWRAHKISWENQTCVMLSLRDVTKILEFERVSAEINSKNLIIRSISHEFRTPINCINLVIDEIMSGLPKETKEKVGFIKMSTELLLFQLNDVLDYSDLSSNKFLMYDLEVNLKKELSHCIDLIKYQSEYKGIKLVSKIDPLIPDKLLIDGYRVQKLVINLLSNALKYTSNGSIELYAINKGKAINIGVKDTGIGISAQRLNDIQELFKENTESSLSGLGLQVCKKILEKFDSCLQIHSEIGQGSVFCFDLNIDPPYLSANDSALNDSALNDELDVPTESLSRSSVRKLSLRIFENEIPEILIVDDNEFNLMCLANILKSEGFPFIEASNGKMAVDKVLAQDQINIPIKVIIMDLNMPIMDGLESCRVIKQLYNQGKISNFPAIIGYTAFTNEDDIRKCYESGMVHCMQKPSPKDDILLFLRKFFDT